MLSAIATLNRPLPNVRNLKEGGGVIPPEQLRKLKGKIGRKKSKLLNCLWWLGGGGRPLRIP